MGFFSLSRTKKSPKTASPSPPPPPPYTRTNSLPPKISSAPPPPPPPPPKPAQLPAPEPTPQWQSQQNHQPNLLPCPIQDLQNGAYPQPTSWNPPPPSYQYDQRQLTHHPIVVNQHYYLSPPPSRPTYTSTATAASMSVMNLGSSVVTMANECLPQSLQVRCFDDGLPAWHAYGSQLVNQGAAAYDQLSHRLNNVLTLIDGEHCKGNERELFTFNPLAPVAAAAPAAAKKASQSGDKTSKKTTKGSTPAKDSKAQTTAVAANIMSGDYFSKVELYANSRLPLNLPPLRLYIPTWPILCLAAQYAERVYERPRGAELDTHVDADWRTGAKAMVIKSVPMDHMDTIVFAIRGTSSFMDWAVNLNTAPTSPVGFLDDPGNFCHAGFLSVARKMLTPVAARLRRLLQEDPTRSGYSLLLTGHSAGGAVAALLYNHMLQTLPSSQSELSSLAGCFRRIHCVTFGAPPVSLLPLSAPPPRADRKSLFLSFVNEGDPVARADKAYVKSLLELFAAPVPSKPAPAGSGKTSKTKTTSSKSSNKRSSSASTTSSSSSSKSATKTPKPTWPVPPSTLSNAGRIVVLRSGESKPKRGPARTVEQRLHEGVVAQVATDEQLRGVVWGDPVAHLMRLYAGRIEVLAVGAVTARGY